MNATAEGKNFSILITDDDSQSRDALLDIIQREGFQTLAAGSGEEAIDIVSVKQVHLVLLDMHMPTLTGIETLQLLRQINAQLPALLVTGDPSERIFRAAIQAQIFSVLPKPVSRNLLVYSVLKVLSQVYGTS